MRTTARLPNSGQRAIHVPDLQNARTTTHTALEPLADAAFKTACHGFKIAMDGIGKPEEYKRGVDILDLGTATLTNINRIVERFNDQAQTPPI